MKQKAPFICALIAASLVNVPAFAQATHFAGFSLAGGLNLATANFARTAANGARLESGITQTSNAVLQAQYDNPVSDSVLIGLGATADIGDLQFGTWQAFNVGIKMKDRYSLYAAPGYALSESTLVYAKLTYLGGTVVDATSKLLEGGAFGLGIKHMLGRKVFLEAELGHSEYAQRIFPGVKDSFSVDALTLSSGYQF